MSQHEPNFIIFAAGLGKATSLLPKKKKELDHELLTE